MASRVYREYYSVPSAILAFNNYNEYTHSITLENKNVPLDENDSRTVPSGAAISVVNGTYRFLPRVKLTQSATTGSAELNVTNPFALMKNDTIDVVLPYEVITVDTAPTSTSDTITVTIGSDIVVNVEITSTETNDKAKTADKIAYSINNHLQANNRVDAIADGVDSVWVMTKSIFERETLSVSTSTNPSASTANGGSLQMNTTSLGTVSSIDRPNGTVTLTSNSNLAVPADVPVGIRNAQIIGLIVHDYDLDHHPNKDYAPLTGSMGVYYQRLPYYDEDMNYQLNRIRFGKKF